MVKRFLLFVCFLQLITVAWAQMSDDQVVNILQDARKKGMSQQEILVVLGQKGVTQEQLLRIKANYESNASAQQGEVVGGDRMRTEEGAEDKKTMQTMLLDSLSFQLKKEVEKPGGNIFGRDVFSNKLLTFEPNINMATPENYVLGPGDEIIIDIWGDAEQTFRQRIAPDGSVVDPKIGPIYLNGITVKEANQRLKGIFGRIYSTIGGSTPTTFIKLSLGEIRSIRINVVGEVVAPGTYTLPSLASLFHALYSAGGVNGIGSLRSVKLFRGGKEKADVDVYEYLLKGKNSLDVRLEDGDVVIVSPYQNLVTLEGKVKRAVVYEMKNNETIGRLLEYAGGFTGDAYKKAVRVIRKSGREYQVYNVEQPNFNEFLLTDGDAVTVNSVINRFENRIEIKGAVYHPGLYALGENILTVKQLIEKAEGVRKDAFMNRAVLTREKASTMPEILALDVKAILDGTAQDVELRANDVLYIPSIFDLMEEYRVSIHGMVGIPGDYPYADNMTIEDLIVNAGGLKEAASVVKIDIARRIKNPKDLTVNSMLAENYSLTLKDGLLVDGQQDFVLKPFDEVYIRRSPGYMKQQSVRVNGEVLFGGDYVLSKKHERLSDLINKAGGLTPEAYVFGARLSRKLNTEERARMETTLKLAQRGGKDSIDVKSLDLGETYFVGIDLREALKNPGSEYDVVLREGDVLIIPEYTGTVKISGAVMYPNTVVYSSKNKLKHYIEQGGGFASRAKKSKVFVIYMNGTVSRTKTFSKAQVKPGCEIIVPVKPPRKGAGLAEIMSIASSTTSMAALVTSILNMTK